MYQLELKKWLVAYRFPVFEGWDVPARCNWARRGRLFLQGRGFQDLYFTSRLWTESPLRSPSPEQHWSRKIGDKITNVCFRVPFCVGKAKLTSGYFRRFSPTTKSRLRTCATPKSCAFSSASKILKPAVEKSRLITLNCSSCRLCLKPRTFSKTKKSRLKAAFNSRRIAA
jgi:hypothetical protein